MGAFLRDVMQKNPTNFRVFGPDETASNRLGALFDVTNRSWMAERFADDDHLAVDGRVMEILSEHACEGWLEGYLLTGRHGLFSCYEAFIHIIDSMFNQHAKWLKVCGEIPWRRPIASLNILLTSHVWRQDHNGFSHQDPGFIDHVVNKKADIIRVYLPPDANTLAVRYRRMSEEPQSGQYHRRRQAAGTPMAGYGGGDQPRQRRHRHVGMGVQRSGRRAGHRAGSRR
jgi:xylulose-5-phosphate/fructose-6-phosphate phosphoketolase